MPFLLLLFLTLACLPERWDQPPPDWVQTPARSAGLTWLGMGLGVAAAVLLSWRTRRRVAHHQGRRDLLLRRYQSWRFYHLLSLFAIYALALYVFGWGWTVQGVCYPNPRTPGPLALATELFILAPFLAALVLSWACFYDAERALHAPSPVSPSEGRSRLPSGTSEEPQVPLGKRDLPSEKDSAESVDAEPATYWSRWAYLGFHVRQNLALVAVPLLLLISVKGLRKLFPDAERDYQLITTIASGLLVAATFVGMPWILRLVLGLRPLPDCPLRTRLLATAKRLRFRCSNILLWNTRGGVANAMVAGVLPIPRYVLLTDRLITDLTPEEVEAVFGHEIGHVKHHHMLYYLSFLVLSLSVIWSGLALFLPDKGEPRGDDLTAIPLMVSVLGAYIFVVFGFLSRRCERQADIYGCRAVSCTRSDCLGHLEDAEMAPAGHGLCPTGIRIFIDALEKVAFLNGISRDRPGWLQSWQHSTIARRVEFLQRMLKDLTLERRFQRMVGIVKWGLLVGLTVCLAVLMYVHR